MFKWIISLIGTILLSFQIVVAHAEGYSYYLPVFNPPPDHYSGLAITNLSETTKASVDIDIIDTNGDLLKTDSLEIKANGQTSFVIGTALRSEGWIEISSSQKLSGLNWFVQMGSSSKSYMASVPFTKTLSKCLLIPHVDLSSKWDETVFLANPNDSSAATVTLTYSNTDGVASTPYVATIPASGSIEISMSTIVGSSTASGGSVAITSTQGLAGFALFNDLKDGNYCFAGINADDVTFEKQITGTYIVTSASGDVGWAVPPVGSTGVFYPDGTYQAHDLTDATYIVSGDNIAGSHTEHAGYTTKWTGTYTYPTFTFNAVTSTGHTGTAIFTKQ